MMTEVFFHGCGDWFIQENGETRLAIDRGIHGSLHVERIYCREYPGIFRLTDDDEKNLQITKDISIIKPSVKELLPSDHPDSVFSKMVDQGKLSPNDFDRCYFMIQKERREKKKYIPVNYELKRIEATSKEAKNRAVSNHPNRSDQLMRLNQASERFWATADPKDKELWPDTKEIIAWLEKQGFSSTLAERAASIIRPEWAGPGRR